MVAFFCRHPYQLHSWSEHHYWLHASDSLSFYVHLTKFDITSRRLRARGKVRTGRIRRWMLFMMLVVCTCEGPGALYYLPGLHEIFDVGYKSEDCPM